MEGLMEETRGNDMVESDLKTPLGVLSAFSAACSSTATSQLASSTEPVCPCDQGGSGSIGLA